MIGVRAQRRRHVGELGGWLWFAISGALVIADPSLLRFGAFPWRLPMRDVLQLIVMSASYFAVVAYVVSMRRDRPRWATLRVIVATIVLFAGAYAALAVFDAFARSRPLFVITAVISAALAVQPASIHKVRTAVIGATVIGVVAIAAGISRNPRELLLANAPVLLQSGLASLELRYHSGLTGPVEGDGGGITTWGDGFLVITGRGVLYRLAWDSTRTAFRSTRLPVPLPIDRGLIWPIGPIRAGRRGCG